MPDKVMTAEARISAKDQTGAAFSSIAGKMKNLAKAAKSMEGLPANLGASSRGLAAFGRQAGGMKKMAASASAFSSAIGSLPVLGGVGAAAGAVMVAKKITDAGAKLQHERIRMETAGMSGSDIADATFEAAKLSAKVPNIGQTSVLHFLRNARTIVGSYQEAAEIAEPMLKMRSMYEAAHPGQDLSEEFDKVIKGLEIKGVTQNLEEFKSYMKGMSKTLNTFGDTVKPSDYYEMFKYGRQSTRGLSQEYMTTVAPTLAQEMGGAQAGTAQQAFFSAMVGGHMTKPAMAQMIKYGLVDPSKVIAPKGGHLAGVKPGGILRSDLAMSNPYEWVQQVLLPQLAKHGVIDPDKIQEIISTLYSKGTAAQLVSLFATQQARIEKDKAQQRGAMDYTAADTFNTKDFSTAMKGVETQFENLAGTIGKPFSETLTPAVADFAKHLGELNEWMAGQNKKKEDGKPTDLDNYTSDVEHHLRYGRRKAAGESFESLDKRTAEKDMADLEKRLSDLEAGTHGRATRGQQSEAANLRIEIARLKSQLAHAQINNIANSPFLKSYDQMTPTKGGPMGFAAFPMTADYDQTPAGRNFPNSIIRGSGSGAYAGIGNNGAPILPGSQSTAGAAPPLDLKAILTGKIEAKLDGTIPVNVTGSAQVNVKVEAGSELIRVTESARNSTAQMALKGASAKPSTGATMPDAGKPK